ncbi:GDSL esterase/lipase At5g03610-like [Euphorbia lathyris]|uniref:GDSL esterase/lipase At5g03610-like n=1 Tax=Euphorbia lathyris TaxID=212925 RepID=UPI0033143386
MNRKRSFLVYYLSSIFINGHALNLFVFGDSYADTGNSPNSSISWKHPYGITFPGTPAGRFSDGRVLTDYIASYLGIESPIPFERRNIGKKSDLKFGMNFAYGGTGVFDTLNNAPNMATQISYFQHLLLEDQVYTKHDLKSSIALISLAGNDYNTYLYKYGNHIQDMGNLTVLIMKEVSKNLKRIHELGVQKIAITSLQPIGCLPAIAIASLQNCSQDWNDASKFHNQMLKQLLQNLNSESKGNVFHLLDTFAAFMSVFNKPNNTGQLTLFPCCRGISSNYSCGDIDKSGANKYIICENPELSIFWDRIHPSQNGWRQLYLALLSSLHQIFP